MNETFEQKLARIEKTRKDWATGDTARDAGLEEPKEVEVYKNISYGEYGEYSLLDVYRPKAAAGRILPVIVNVHGGGFFYGDKELYRFYAMQFAKGTDDAFFAVVNINYRLVPDYVYPAPLCDIAKVMEWIAKSKDAYGFDIDKVFVIGDSAGAQLAAQYAVIATNDKYADIINIHHPKNVVIKGVSLACGLYDLASTDIRKAVESVDDYLDGTDLEAESLKFLDYIDENYPSTYIFSAREDFLRDAFEPMKRLINSRGGRADGLIYGLDCDTPAYHVFHVDMRNPLGQKADLDQIRFFEEKSRQ